jgi:hypothetical protein
MRTKASDWYLVNSEECRRVMMVVCGVDKGEDPT